MGDPFSAAAGIIDLLCKAKELCGKFKDVKDLPNAFEAIASQIHLASSIFEKVKKNTSVISQDPKVQAAIDSCRADAESLNAIYELVSKNRQNNQVKRYWSYVKDVGKDRTGAVEKIWERLLDEIEEAIVTLQALPSSLEISTGSDTYNVFADNVGVQGHNSGEVTMGNKYMGDHNENHGAGRMLTLLSLIQWAGALLIQCSLQHKTSTDREKRILEALQRLETLRPVCITAGTACVLQVRVAQAQLRIRASLSNSTTVYIEPAATSGEVVQRHALFEEAWKDAYPRELVLEPRESLLPSATQRITKPLWRYSTTLSGEDTYSMGTDELLMGVGAFFSDPSPYDVNELQPSSRLSPQQIQRYREAQVWLSTCRKITRRTPLGGPERHVPTVVVGNEERSLRKVQSARFSAVRVFQVLWSEPAGGGPTVTKPDLGCCLLS